LAAQADVDAAGEMLAGEFRGFANVKKLGACIGHVQHLVELKRLEHLFKVLLQRCALTRVEDCVIGEVGRSVRLVRRDKLDEFLFAHRLQRVIGAPLNTQGRNRVRRKIFAAQGPGAVRRIDKGFVRKRQKLVMQRVEEVCAKVMGAPPERCAQVGAANVANEQRIAGKHRVRSDGIFFVIENQNRD
jgi:hypothetical protein